MKRIILLFATFFLWVPALANADTDEEGNIQKLLTTTHTVSGQRITVPAHPKLQVMILTIPPGKSLPVHKHPYPRYAYVEKGELDLTLVDEKKVIHFKKGDFFAEVIDGWHFGTNNGKNPVELLVIDQMPEDADKNVVLKQ